jgi:membrane protein DedA with SNARE-associated domain
MTITCAILRAVLNGSIGLVDSWNELVVWFSGYSGLAVFLLAIGDSSFISVPEGNDFLIVLLSAGGSWSNMAYYVCMTIVGSIVGCLVLYMIGRRGGRSLLQKRFSEAKIERAETLYRKHGLAAVLISSILPPPLPFKIFVLSAGVFGLSPVRFFSAIVIGRSIRYTLWGILAVLYGNSIKLFLINNIKTAGVTIFIAIIIMTASALVFSMCKKKSRAKEAAERK